MQFFLLLQGFFFCLLLIKMYHFMTTELSWATLHFIVAFHLPMQTFLFTGVYALFTKSDVLLTQFEVKTDHRVALKMNVFF